MDNKKFALDGHWYDVYVPSDGIKRDVAILDGKNAGRSVDGGMVFDTIGTYFNGSITVLRNDERLDEYDALHKALRSPKRRTHMLTIPFDQGVITYPVYVANISDALERSIDGKNYWNRMEVKFTATGPNERP